jgi:hypothetical protein
MLTLEHKAKIQEFTSSHNGKPLDQKALLRPNQMIGKALVARFMSMTPQQQQAIKAIATPQTADALKILLPELGQLIDKGAANGGPTG